MKLSDLENYRRSDGYISIDDIGFVARPEGERLDATCGYKCIT